MTDSNTKNTKVASSFTQIFGGSTGAEPRNIASNRSGGAAGQPAPKKVSEPSPAPLPQPSSEPRDAVGNRAGNTSTSDIPTRDADRIEAIRDLLVSDQVGEIRESMRSLEKQLIERITKFEIDTRADIESSERQLRQEFESLAAGLHKEAVTRETLSKEIGARISSTSEELGSEISKIGDELTRNITETRKHNEEASEKTIRYQSRLDQELGSIRKSYSRREDVGALFVELGKRLIGSPPEAI